MWYDTKLHHLYPEDGGSKALRKFVSYHIATLSPNLEDRDPKLKKRTRTEALRHHLLSETE